MIGEKIKAWLQKQDIKVEVDPAINLFGIITVSAGKIRINRDADKWSKIEKEKIADLLQKTVKVSLEDYRECLKEETKAKKDEEIKCEIKNIIEYFKKEIKELLKLLEIKIEPEIKSLMPIQKAMAAQADLEPNRFRWRPLFWPDVGGLFKRRECEQILQLFDKTNVVLLEGYPASGKTSIVCRLAYDLVNKGERVYYGNLTTRIGLKCTQEDLPRNLLTESKEVTQKTFIIIEDIHHSISEYARLNPLSAHRHIKLLLTSRPLEQFEIESYLSRHQQERMRVFQWIAPRNRITLKTNQEVVEEILDHENLAFNSPEPIMNIVGKREPNLLLLSFLIQASLERGRRVHEIERYEILNSVKHHLKQLAECVCNSIPDQTPYWRLMETISVLSESEVPVEKDFLGRLPGINDLSLQILKQLEREKEIVCFERFPVFEKYYLIPHSQLASLYRSVCTNDEERFEILRKYLLQGEFFGKLTHRLASEAPKLLENITRRFGTELIKRDLSKASLGEIEFFIRGISEVDKVIARELVHTQKDVLDQKLSKASLMEIVDFIRGGISEADKEIARELVHTQRDILRNKDLSKASVEEAGVFLWGISGADKEIARELVHTQRDILRNKDLSKASVEEAGVFLWGISGADKEIARELVHTQRDILRNKDLS